MSDIHLRQLPAECFPQLNSFYRAHRSHMRVPAGARCWVVGNQEIVAGLCLARVDGGHWLTGLLVAPALRNQGLARRLINQALSSCDGPVWLFCDPRLIIFYQQLGFNLSSALPESLADRLRRYNRNKTLAALRHDNAR